MTHPANWAAGRRQELWAAAQTTGIEQVQLMAEPVAAAAEILSAPAGALVGVVDLGVDSVRAFIVRRRDATFELVGPPAIREGTGGDLVDAGIIGHLEQGRLRRHAQWGRVVDPCGPAERAIGAGFMSSVQQAKVALGDTLATEIEGPDDSVRIQLTRDELDGLVEPVAHHAVDVLEALLRDAKFAITDLHALILVGGTSGFPIVADVMWGRTGMRPVVPVDPEAAIARGAVMTPVANGAGRCTYHPRLAADPIVAGWNRGAAVVASVSVTKGSLRVTVNDVASCGGVEALAAATARHWADTNRGYAERALYPMTVLGTPGLERRFEIDGQSGPEGYLERYAVVEGRSIVISAPDHLHHIVEGIQRRPSYSGVSGRYESLIGVEVPRGWMIAEKLVVIRAETGQQSTAASQVLPVGMTADSWIAAQVAEADDVDGYYRAEVGAATFLGDLPATLVTYQQHSSVGHPDASTYIRQVFLGVVDGTGYRVTTTSSYHDQAVGTFAAYSGITAHLTLVDRPPTADLVVRAGVALSNKIAGIRRFWREVAPKPQ